MSLNSNKIHTHKTTTKNYKTNKNKTNKPLTQNTKNNIPLPHKHKTPQEKTRNNTSIKGLLFPHKQKSPVHNSHILGINVWSFIRFRSREADNVCWSVYIFITLMNGFRFLSLIAHHYICHAILWLNAKSSDSFAAWW